jgi:hypothetical protein
MVFKSYSVTRDYEPERRRNNLEDGIITPPRVEGNLIALVGKPEKNLPSTRRKEERIEILDKIDDEILGYNINGKICLMKTKKNSSSFDNYIAMPFTKGVTERGTGRTLLILGSSSHHGEAMVGEFSGVLWEPYLNKEIKKYGDTIRWINVGDTKTGFIGLDFNPLAKEDEGVARNLEDVRFLAVNLLEFGYDSEKRLFLLKPPYIVESDYGKELRKKGYEKLKDWKIVK